MNVSEDVGPCLEACNQGESVAMVVVPRVVVDKLIVSWFASRLLVADQVINRRFVSLGSVVEVSSVHVFSA